MKRMFTISLIRFLLIFVLAKPAYAGDVLAGQSAELKTATPSVESKTKDLRAEKLKTYLEKHKSPLAPYAHIFVQKADKYNLPDWKLVPAITGVESTFGKRIPFQSYNAYGWANGNYSFQDWEESIDVVTKTLKEKYYNRGADTVEKIGRIYAPPSVTWSGKVRFFMGEIEKNSRIRPQDLSLNL